MKIIYLWVKNEGWKAFDFDTAETKQALVDRHIMIDNSAKIGVFVRIGGYTTIGESARIGDSACVGQSVTIGKYVTIGDNATIEFTATIGDSARIGESARIGHYVTIGKSTRIGDHVTIGGYARIGGKEVIKKSLFITGSRHTVNWFSTGIIHIGCYKEEIKWWLENYKAVGKKEHYTKKQIEEYGEYIKCCDILQKSVKVKVKP